MSGFNPFRPQTAKEWQREYNKVFDDAIESYFDDYAQEVYDDESKESSSRADERGAE